ncbi:MAG: sulfotransferase domain-containing protein [Acidobacteria bacterium]|nr:sulfotransferase domain-containing protein [Acidobacteriota bacterium]
MREVVSENDFASRTGRAPGEENTFSHRRKGQPGDWRNHFDLETGRAFEELFPRLLIDLGYEQSTGWWQALDAPCEQPPPPEELERKQWLTVLEEFNTELNVVRIAVTARIALEQRWNYKLGFLPLRRLFGLFKDGSR